MSEMNNGHQIVVLIDTAVSPFDVLRLQLLLGSNGFSNSAPQ
jgi:hypothetical protein